MWSLLTLNLRDTGWLCSFGIRILENSASDRYSRECVSRCQWLVRPSPPLRIFHASLSALLPSRHDRLFSGRGGKLHTPLFLCKP